MFIKFNLLTLLALFSLSFAAPNSKSHSKFADLVKLATDSIAAEAKLLQHHASHAIDKVLKKPEVNHKYQDLIESFKKSTDSVIHKTELIIQDAQEALKHAGEGGVIVIDTMDDEDKEALKNFTLIAHKISNEAAQIAQSIIETEEKTRQKLSTFTNREVALAEHELLDLVSHLESLFSVGDNIDTKAQEIAAKLKHGMLHITEPELPVPEQTEPEL
jgi:hypothetical protein